MTPILAFYLRLSEADGDLGSEGKDESNSIENQRLLLQSFVDDREDIRGEVREYIDDGYTGTNFKRPAFMQMIEEAKMGKISTILVKDLSRLGRDYIIVGDYIEQIFPMLNVRFIAVNNNYDSKEHQNEAMSFDVAVSNLVNTFYSRDLSKKQTSAHKAKWQKGCSTSGTAPYGYKKSPSEKGKLVVDPEAAEIVKQIFERAAKGFKTREIALKLNEAKIPTPMEYMIAHNLLPKREVITPEKERLWNSSMVSSIIRKYEYTGALVIGKRRTLSIGDKSVRTKPKTEWTVVDGVNEQIIPTALFNEANLTLTKPRSSAYITKQKYPLKGKIRCGNCHHALSRAVSTYKEYYICSHGTQIDKYSSCCKEQYPVKSIEHVVWRALKEHIRVLQQTGLMVIDETKSEIKQIKCVQKNIKEKVIQLKEAKIQQYELYASGVISRETYQRKKEALSRQIEYVEQEIEQQETRLIERGELCSTATNAIKLAESFSADDKITIDAVDNFIEVVYVYDPNRIEIVFRFEDFLRECSEQSNNQKEDSEAMYI